MKTDLAKLKKIAHDNLDLIFSALDIECDTKGKYLVSCCPVHEESDNPQAFSYNKEKNTWKCWTHSCEQNYNYDVFGLIRGVISKKENKEASFGDTIKWLYKILNLDYKSISKEDVIKTYEPNEFQRLVKKINAKPNATNPKTALVYPKQMPSRYFISRGFRSDTLKEFDVGDCQDRTSEMRFRSIIPAHDHNGKLVGSICRAIPDYIEPKFKADFDKSNYLYNYHRAKNIAKQKSAMVVVEGQGDVWRLWECGVKNAVGCYGKEIYDNQKLLLEQIGITRLVIIMDHDQPGREAKIKIKRMLGRYFKLYFIDTPTKRDIGEMSPDHIEEKILSKIRGLY